MRVIAVLLLALLLALLLRDGAEAKGTTYLLSGGELGEYAMVLPGFIPDEDGTDWDAGAEGVLTPPPGDAPLLGYDLYRRYGNLAVPHQMSVTGPELHYYPELRLVHHVWYGNWYEMPDAAVEYLDAQIDEALAKKSRGQLEASPIAADFRDRSLQAVTYWARPPSSVALGESYASPMSCDGLDDCAVIASPGGQFIMRHLVETVSGPVLGPTSDRPAFVIEYYGIILPPYGGIGGLLGFYDPPSDGHPGRFRYDGYFHDQPSLYHETTPGFDAAIADALARQAAAAKEPGRASEDAPGATRGRTLFDGLSAAVGAAALIAGMVALRPALRRQGSP